MDYTRIFKRVCGVQSSVTGGIFDWTIPNFSRCITAPWQISSYQKMTTEDSCIWYFTMSSCGFSTGSTDEKRITFSLKCGKGTSNTNKIALRWKFKWGLNSCWHLFERLFYWVSSFYVAVFWMLEAKISFTKEVTTFGMKAGLRRKKCVVNLQANSSRWTYRVQIFGKHAMRNHSWWLTTL